MNHSGKSGEPVASDLGLHHLLRLSVQIHRVNKVQHGSALDKILNKIGHFELFYQPILH